MKSSAKKVELASVDDLFSTEESRADAQREKVLEIPLSELHPFKDHPFKVKDDEAMMETADSIRQYGVLVPAIARPDPNGGYELVAGHRRHRASELAGKDTMPVIVRDLDDDQATIIMVDSNLQRESLLPSERAFAYKMKLEAMKRQAGRPSKENCSQLGNDFGKKSSEVLAEQVGQSKNQIFRYIRLTELIPELLDMVDEKKIAFNPAYELSFLKKEEQRDLLDAMDSEQATPSLSQAQRLKKYSQEGHLTLDMMRVIMGEEKKNDLDKISPASIELGQASIFVEKELQRVNREAMADLNGKDIMFKFPPTFASTHTALVLKTPKTKTSVRKVFLPKTVAEMLVQRKADIEELKDLFGDEFVDFNLVFCSSNGKPIEGQVINRAFNKLIEENGLPKVVFHSLRHSSITYKLKLNGGDMKSVQGDSGHAQVKMVADVYSHIIDDDRRLNAERLEAAFYSGRQATPEPVKPVTQESSTDDKELLLKLLQNPEMAALLKSLAKTL